MERKTPKDHVDRYLKRIGLVWVPGGKIYNAMVAMVNRAMDEAREEAARQCEKYGGEKGKFMAGAIRAKGNLE